MEQVIVIQVKLSLRLVTLCLEFSLQAIHQVSFVKLNVNLNFINWSKDKENKKLKVNKKLI